MKKLFFTIFIISIILSLLSPRASAANEITHGLDIIRRKTELIKTTSDSEKMLFSPEEFDKAFGIGKVEFIIITELPFPEEGILKLGGTDITVGQGISRANIPLIEFIPINGEVKEGHFIFKCWGKSMKVKINITDGVSLEAPTAFDMMLDVYSSIPFTGKLCSDGDCKYQITQAPEHGYLSLTDAASGGFVYKPRSGYTGIDSFGFECISKNGLSSKEASVEIKITSPQMTFDDLSSSCYHTAAVFLESLGAADYTVDGDKHLYGSNAEMSRGSFACMLTKVLGVSELGEQSVFFTDGFDGSKEAVAVRTAYYNGIMTAVLTTDGRKAATEQCITSAEAYDAIENFLVGEYPSECIHHRLYSSRDSEILTKGKAAGLIYSAYRIDNGQTNISEIFN